VESPLLSVPNIVAVSAGFIDVILILSVSNVLDVGNEIPVDKTSFPPSTLIDSSPI